MRRARGAHGFVCAAALGLIVGACTLMSDLDRLKGEDGGLGGTPQDAGSEEPPPCEPGNCVCTNCTDWCACSALPAAQEKCKLDCVAGGLFP